MDTMPPAPWLPSVLDEPADEPRQAGTGQVRAPRAAGNRRSQLLAAVAEQRRRATELYQAHQRHQIDVYHEFLRLRDQTLAALGRTSSATAVPTNAPVSPAGQHPPLGEPDPDARRDPPVIACPVRRFDRERLRAYAGGRLADCFGPGWELTRAHVRTPRLDADEAMLPDEITDLDPAGGPWQRGYLRAETTVPAPAGSDAAGRALFAGCLHVLGFYLTALGFTVDRDGWSFAPEGDRAAELSTGYRATAGTGRLIWEAFVTEVRADPEPMVVADLLGTMDGAPVCQLRRLALRLVPDWPLNRWRELGPPAVQPTGELVPLPTLGGLAGHRETRPVATIDGVPLGYRSMLAVAWGRPSEVYGPAFQQFDGVRRAPRLPGPPFHFVSRIVSVDGPAGGMRTGTRLTAEYDVPEQVWYFAENGYATMPTAILMEVALQPCGCLAMLVGSTLGTDVDLKFRNLDGTGTVLGEVCPQTRLVRTEVELLTIARQGDMVVESFAVRCHADGVPVFEATTTFGFFPAEAFEDQPGIPPSADELVELTEESDYLLELPPGPGAGAAQLAGPMLLMLDRITGYWPRGGRAGLGRARAEKDVDAGEWFFKCHFFQDPVQPGSLGIEAMCQLLQFHLIESAATAEVTNPRFEPIMLERELVWKYRGQVVPTDGRITVEMEVVESGTDDRGRYAVADFWLWVDGRRIYQVRGLGMRVVQAEPAGTSRPATVDTVFDPEENTWIADHRPSWTLPTLPMMSMVDLLAGAAADFTGGEVVSISNVQLRRWLVTTGPVRLRTEVEPGPDGLAVRLLTWRDLPRAELSRYELVAGGTVRVGVFPSQRPEPFPPLADAAPAPDPYETAAIFNGPAFQYLTTLHSGTTGSTATLDAGRGWVPRGQLHQGLLDATLHGIPHTDLALWAPDIERGGVAVPHRLVSLDLYEPLPDEGPLLVEARFGGFAGDDRRLPVFDIQLQLDGRVLVALRVVEIVLPLFGYGPITTTELRSFARDRCYQKGHGLSTSVGGMTRVGAGTVDRFDIPAGAVAYIYGLPSGSRGRDHLPSIAAKDHLARFFKVHPFAVEVDRDLRAAQVTDSPGTRRQIRVDRDNDTVLVRFVDEARP